MMLGGPRSDRYHDDCFGFYWTEGLRGLGWAQDAVPTLKGGSTVGIPSPPGIWCPAGELGRRIVVPGIEDAERLQGFPRGWTAAGNGCRTSQGHTMEARGNAVTVGVSAWLVSASATRASRSSREQRCRQETVGRTQRSAPAARSGQSTSPCGRPTQRYQHLAGIVDLASAQPLSARGAAGFLSSARRAKLRFVDDFLDDLEEHVALMSGEVSVVA